VEGKVSKDGKKASIAFMAPKRAPREESNATKENETLKA